MAEKSTARGGIEGYPTGLSWHQHHRAARVVASASTDAVDCALLLAALGIHPADGLPSATGTGVAAGPGPVDAAHGIRRRRHTGRRSRD